MRASWVVGLAAALYSTTALAQAPLPPPKTFSSAVLDSPPAQALSIDTDVLPLIQPGATPPMRKITPANLLGASGFAYANACNPVVTYGADPTGNHSANAAINRCNGTQKNGQYVNTFLPGGTYKLTDALTISHGQCLVVEPGLTVFSIGYDFSNAAVGALVVSGGGVYGGSSVPCIKGDPIFVFEQPTNIGSRANFAALGSCGNNGSGCQYPPAINFTGAQRFDIEAVTIANAYDCIKGDGSNAGDGNDHWGIIRCGAFNRGLDLSGIKDVIHVDAYFFWPYGVSVDNNTNVFSDGSTYAAVFGEVDGFSADTFFSLSGRTIIDSAAGWYHFGDLELDSVNATFKVTAAKWVTISGGYATSYPSGFNTDCPIQNSADFLQLSNFRTGHGNAASVCNFGGNITIANSAFVQLTTTQPAIYQQTGTMVLTGNRIETFGAGPWTASGLVWVDGGSLVETGNQYSAVPTSGTAVFAPDNANTIITGNVFNGWSFSPPGSAGTYWPNKLNSAGDTGSAYVRNGSATVDLDSATDAAATHLFVRGYSDPNLQAWLGLNTTGEYGVLQAYKQGAGVKPLHIQPLGGASAFGGALSAVSLTTTNGAVTAIQDFNGVTSGQVLIEGATNNNKQMWLGLDTTGNQGVLQAYLQGTAALPLAIQPLGGGLTINGTAAVSCAITGATAHLTVVNGIVTLCD